MPQLSRRNHEDGMQTAGTLKHTMVSGRRGQMINHEATTLTTDRHLALDNTHTDSEPGTASHDRDVEVDDVTYTINNRK